MSSTATAVGTVKRFWAMNGPVLPMPTGLLVLGGEGMVDCPFPTFLIEHEKGLVLLDTGLRPQAAEDPVGAYGELGSALFPEGFDRDLGVDRQLAKLGFRPEDVDTVILSHLHFDHVGGLPLFQHAQIIAGRGEMAAALWPDPATAIAGFYNAEDVAWLRDRRSQWWEIGPQDHDLFGDGSVMLFHLPGHTPGQLAILVRTPGENLLMATDVVHLRAGLTGVPMPYDWNAAETASSVMRLHALARAHDARIWISHDPEDWAEGRHAPDVYDGSVG
jgi:glyoxylase-like metal-dependent hydrolase (beta-lactamase superfamily II)